MSLRDEMVSKAQEAYRRGFTPGEMVDDLMPLVERAVRSGVLEALDPATLMGTPRVAKAEMIVARVTGRGEL